MNLARISFAFVIIPMIFCSATIAQVRQRTNFYLDAISGSDTSTGQSANAAWKTLARVQSATFNPGDSILFKRGCNFPGVLTFRHSGTIEFPIVFSAYGIGHAPAFSNPSWDIINGNIFQLYGKYIHLDNLYFHDGAIPPDTKKRKVQKMGAVYLDITSANNVVKNCEFNKCPVGIKVKGRHHLITKNNLHDVPYAISEDWGPMAIMVVSPYNEICHNIITNYGYFGGLYGSDGGAIEIDGEDYDYDGRGIIIHHNVSRDNHGFLEIAGSSDSITIAYNISDDWDKFVGGGATKNTFIFNNTVIRIRTPHTDPIFWSFYPDSSSFYLKNNIFVTDTGRTIFMPAVGSGHLTGLGNPPHDHNLYFQWGNVKANPVGVPLGPGEIIADPLFVDFAKKDFRLTNRSPAKEKGIVLSFSKWSCGTTLRTKRPNIGAL